MSADTQSHYRRLVREAAALFGATHYDHYEFLWSLTDQIMPDGLEHHQSSDDRSPLRALLDDPIRRAEANLLSHEYVHSWNGKYRRPAGLATANYQDPMLGDMLWVYEGLTEYLGDVLAARSGLLTAEELAGRARSRCGRDAVAQRARVAVASRHHGGGIAPLLSVAQLGGEAAAAGRFLSGIRAAVAGGRHAHQAAVEGAQEPG